MLDGARLKDAYSLSWKGGSSTGRVGAVAPIIAGIYLALVCGEDLEKIEVFCKVLNTGFDDLSNCTPAIILRNYMVAKGRLRDSVDRRNVFKITQDAINDFINGKERRIMYRSPKGKYEDGFKKWFFSQADKEGKGTKAV